MKYTLISFVIAVALILTSTTVFSSEVIIIKSSPIIPYQTVIDEFKRKFSKGAFEEYSIDEDYEDKGKFILERALKKSGDLILAVGPEAAYLVGKNSPSIAIPKIFTVVRNPEKLLKRCNTSYHGVSQNIPVGFQLERIKLGFPTRKRIGVLYTPKENKTTIDHISRIASDSDLLIVGLPIASQKEISKVLNSPQCNIDILCIGYEKIIKYLIKTMLRKKIPVVVGFTEEFAQDGALLSFYLDYQEIGEQTAEFAQKLLLKGTSLTPVIQEPLKVRTIVNLKVAGKLEIAISDALIETTSEVVK
jgi:ABC-type uncharacterized transport system substrate-binding protein